MEIVVELLRYLQIVNLYFEKFFKCRGEGNYDMHMSDSGPCHVMTGCTFRNIVSV